MLPLHHAVGMCNQDKKDSDISTQFALTRDTAHMLTHDCRNGIQCSPWLSAFGKTACAVLLWRSTPRRMLGYRTRLTEEEHAAIKAGDDEALPEYARIVAGSTVRVF